MPRKKYVKPPKPPLSPRLKTLISTGRFSLSVHIFLGSGVEDEELREQGTSIEGDIICSPFWEIDDEFDDDFDDGIKIGSIEAWRLKAVNADDATDWADSSEGSVKRAINWLFNQQTMFDMEDVLTKERPILLDRIEIKPEWRGYGLALPAVATFLDLIDCGFVFLKAHPFYSADEKAPPKDRLKKRTQALIRYWQKLELDQCEIEPQMLAGFWDCPEWLQANGYLQWHRRLSTRGIKS